MKYRLAYALTAVALAASACSDGSDATESSSVVTDGSSVETELSVAEPPSPTTAGGTDGTTATDGLAVAPDRPFPDERCEANRAVGSISYLTGFDFAATASIVDVLVARDRGYYEELCLDVDVASGFSTANYPLVAANDAQFSSSGSFSELATFSATNEADLVALAVEGHVAIDGLMVKPEVGSLEAIEGTTIGVKGKLPPSIAAMLAEIGLVEGEHFETLLLEGFDPLAHWEVEGISAVPGWKSNEPGTLERAGVPFELYDPADLDIPGSFGLIYTNRTFLDEHPTAAEDFMRATMRGLADAIADPAAAAAVAVELINGNGNPNFLSPEGEAFRWETDAELVLATTPEGSHPGVPDPDGLAAEIAAYDAVGVYGVDGPPPVDGRYDADLVAGVYADDGTVIWPGS